MSRRPRRSGTNANACSLQWTSVSPPRPNNKRIVTPNTLQLIILGLFGGILSTLVILIARQINGRTLLENRIRDLESAVNDISIEKSVLEERYRSAAAEVESLNKTLREKESAVIDLTSQIAALNTAYEHLMEKHEEKRHEAGKLKEQFQAEFQNLANGILEETTRKFTEQNLTGVKGVLSPVRERMAEFQKRIEDTQDKASKERLLLRTEIQNLAALNQRIGKEAENLTRALKYESKTRGTWGELILESILEKSGLVKGREYFVQERYRQADGKGLQPDVVIRFPDDRNIIVDSKVSLNAYERYCSAEDGPEREKALKDHIRAVKKHIDDLSGKKYQDIESITTIEYVMMFLPVEPAYFLAVRHDESLWDYAGERRILLTSPTNLFAILKMIHGFWRQDQQNRNVAEIAARAGALYDKFAGFINDLSDVGNKLEAAQKAHGDAVQKLCKGKGNLVNRVEALKQLGAKAKKTIPEEFIDPENSREENSTASHRPGKTR